MGVPLLVVGAGPYGVAVAARALEKGIDTAVVGHPMGFWADHMPQGMFLRSGLDWHLDASETHTFEAFIEERGLSGADIDPVPIAVFLAYADWFVAQKRVRVRDELVRRLVRADDAYLAVLDDGTHIEAERVVVAAGSGYFRHLPEWAAALPGGVGAHTCDLVRFEALAGARVMIVGGRQSAYEWAALLGEHGAERVDIVHRHDVPRFERVSWKFLDPYVESTLNHRGWWRSLPPGEREKIARQFWEVGRLTLEWWLTPRLRDARIHHWPNTHVVGVGAGGADTVELELSIGDRLGVDRVVFATGYRSHVASVPYLEDLAGLIDVVDGFPVLDDAFQSTLAGLYFPGFAATRDFGPFFGFTKGCPAAASLIVDDLLRAV